ncbi:hypothetical protein [Arthrobacter rhizosphaerae]|uniref:hypothetical protein n=1 Tax=Arthrobacter rhizosphaerae TaxID=2855490 RepID=UPI001FF22BEF|nr:hypothetical protein [Arthrobacter rhizosphaerae]
MDRRGDLGGEVRSHSVDVDGECTVGSADAVFHEREAADGAQLHGSVEIQRLEFAVEHFQAVLELGQTALVVVVAHRASLL